MELPEAITFDLELDLAEKYGLDAKGLSATSTLGTVSVRGNRVYWNGKRLGGTEEDAVLDACRDAYGN